MPEPRNYIFANGSAYSIFLTVAHVVTHYQGDAADECVRELINAQYSNMVPDFLVDLEPLEDDIAHHCLLFTDLWLYRYGVPAAWSIAEQLLRDADDDGSIGSWEEASVVGVIGEMQQTMGELLAIPAFCNYYYNDPDDEAIESEVEEDPIIEDDPPNGRWV